MSTLLSPTRWAEVKEDLAKRVAFVGGFVTPVEVEVWNRIQAMPPYPYVLEPRLFDVYIHDVVGSLDRCLSYRREARDLEIAGVKAALEYDHFTKSRPVEQDLEKLGLGINVQVTRSGAVKQALNNIDPKASDVNHVAYEYLEAEDQTMSAALGNLNSRSNDIDQKWNLAASLQDDFHSRYIAPGNAHNYPERYSRVVGIYADEMYEMIAKAGAVSDGIDLIYGTGMVPPPPKYADDPEAFLDPIVIWARDVTRFLRSHDDNTSTYDMIVPLVQPWLAAPSGPFIAPGDFKRDITAQGPQKFLNFTFADSIFGPNAVRIVGMGLSFGYNVPISNDPTWRDEASGYRLRATIHTPAQKGKNGLYKRPPVIFGNVAFHAADAPVAWTEGNSCRNLDPTGDWQIVVEERIVWFDGKEHKVSSGFFSLSIPDIKLTLRLKAEVKP